MLFPTGSFTEADPRIARSPGFRTIRVSIMAALIGVAAGLVAFALLRLIALLTNLTFFHTISFELRDFGGVSLPPWIIVVPAIGGLIVGLMAKYGTSQIKGHGIPEAMEAVLVNRSRIQARVAILKPISTAIAIGTGGPFGAEGPIIQTGGALGSLLGQLVRTTAAERKVLLACGAGAGMAATFSTPIAGVIIAIELLLFEFKSRSFIPLVIASTLATSMHLLLLGQGPLFTMAPTDYGVPAALPWYLLLGLLCGIAAVGFTRALYLVEDFFERLPVNELWLPAIGGLGLGVLGFLVPRVLGVGYGTITEILNARIALGMLLVLILFKSAALLVSLGSGTSGGLLAPMFMASAAMGGAFAMLVNQLVPGASLSPAAFALVAMGAVFGAASRATFAFIIFAFEITRDYNAILPLMLVGVVADAIALLFMRDTIMTKKLARRGLRVHTDYEPDVLHRVAVSEVMDRNPPLFPASTKVSELADRIARADPQLVHHGLLLVDHDGRLEGVLTRKDIVAAIESGAGEVLIAVDAGTDDVVVAFPDESVHEAALRMLRANVGRLPVVSRDDERAVVGYLDRGAIMSARRKALDEEGVMEPGWLTRARPPAPAS